MNVEWSEGKRWFMPKYIGSGGDRVVEFDGSVSMDNLNWEKQENNSRLAVVLRWIWHNSSIFRWLCG